MVGAEVDRRLHRQTCSLGNLPIQDLGLSAWRTEPLSLRLPATSISSAESKQVRRAQAEAPIMLASQTHVVNLSLNLSMPAVEKDRIAAVGSAPNRLAKGDISPVHYCLKNRKEHGIPYRNQ